MKILPNGKRGYNVGFTYRNTIIWWCFFGIKKYYTYLPHKCLLVCFIHKQLLNRLFYPAAPGPCGPPPFPCCTWIMWAPFSTALGSCGPPPSPLLHLDRVGPLLSPSALGSCGPPPSPLLHLDHVGLLPLPCCTWTIWALPSRSLLPKVN